MHMHMQTKTTMRLTRVAILGLGLLGCAGDGSSQIGAGGTGAAGAAGVDGGRGGVAAGASGAGTTDAAGSTGAAGGAGAAGSTGVAGTAGTTGAAGRGGTTGAGAVAGAAGSSGAAGRGGAAGAAGSAGSAGTAGRGGSTGTAGSTAGGGAPGTAGGAGTAGATGPGGAAGSAWPQCYADDKMPADDAAFMQRAPATDYKTQVAFGGVAMLIGPNRQACLTDSLVRFDVADLNGEIKDVVEGLGFPAFGDWKNGYYMNWVILNSGIPGATLSAQGGHQGDRWGHMNFESTEEAPCNWGTGDNSNRGAALHESIHALQAELWAFNNQASGWIHEAHNCYLGRSAPTSSTTSTRWATARRSRCRWRTCPSNRWVCSPTGRWPARPISSRAARRTSTASSATASRSSSSA
jgi:hypothetical protein